MCIGQGIEWSVSDPSAITQMRVKVKNAPRLTHGGSAQDAVAYKDGVPVPDCAPEGPGPGARDAVHRVEVHQLARGLADHVPGGRERPEGEDLSQIVYVWPRDGSTFELALGRPEGPRLTA